jgi:cytochrome o ubiquinol oxidase subunit IV
MSRAGNPYDNATGPDNTNNVLALAFGVLIVMLLIVGSVWVMCNISHNMMPMVIP